jgi:ankyrin repeat protein
VTHHTHARLQTLVAMTALAVALSACASDPGDSGVLEPSASTVQYETLIDAVNADDVAAVQALLEAGADPDEDPGNGFLPLHVASLRGDVDIVDLLIEAGADPNIRASDGQQAIVMAAGGDHGEVITVLIAGGADPEATYGGQKRTALMQATFNDSLSAIEALVAGGVDIDRRDDALGMNALMHAASLGKEDVLRKLLELGADGSSLDTSGSTARDWAESYDYDGSVAILEEFGYTQ